MLTVLPGRRVTLVLCTRDGAVLGSVPPFDVPVPWWQEVSDVVSAARDGARPGRRTAAAADDEQPVVVRRRRHLPRRGRRAAGRCARAVDRSDNGGRPPAASVVGASRRSGRRPRLGRRGARPARDAADRARRVQMRTWNLSSLWRLPTASGVAWLKVVPPFFAHEGADAGDLRPDSAAAADRARRSAGAARGGAGRGSVRRPAAAARAHGGHAGQACRSSGRVAPTSCCALGADDWRSTALEDLAAGTVERFAPDLDVAVARRLESLVGVVATAVRRHRLMRGAGDVGAR